MAEPTIPIRLTADQITYLVEAIKEANPDIQTALNLRGTPGVKLAIRLIEAREKLEDDLIEGLIGNPP